MADLTIGAYGPFRPELSAVDVTMAALAAQGAPSIDLLISPKMTGKARRGQMSTLQRKSQNLMIPDAEGGRGKTLLVVTAFTGRGCVLRADDTTMGILMTVSTGIETA